MGDRRITEHDSWTTGRTEILFLFPERRSVHGDSMCKESEG